MAKSRIFITGATSGIGRQLALDLLAQDHQVTGCGLTREKIDSLRAMAPQGGPFFRWDLLKPMPNLPPELLAGEKFAGVVFCAGVSTLAPITVCTEEQLEHTWRLHFLSSFSILKGLILGKRLADHASVVFLSSFAARHPSKGQLAYSASKISLESLVKTMIQEFSFKKKWRFNLVSPAQIESEMVKKSSAQLGDEQIAKHRATYPFGFGQISDVSHLIQFLLDPEKSGYINGANISLDGGLEQLSIL